MTTLNRFLSNTLNQYFGKQYTPDEVKDKLKSEIRMLEQSLFHLEPDSKLFRDKYDLLKIKRSNLEQIEKEN